MLKTLVWKESRELAPLVALAIFAQLLLPLVTMLPVFLLTESRRIPFVNDWFTAWILFVGTLAAIAIGFWQTTGELVRGTFLFLLHRPLDRLSIFSIKLLVGVVLTLLVAGLPLVIYALWAATPGTHASPFLWAMTTGSWLTWARLPVIYLGAFLSGLRPGRWLGSRALPLAAALLFYLLLFSLAAWPWIALIATLAVEAGFLVVICHVAATRDYS